MTLQMESVTLHPEVVAKIRRHAQEQAAKGDYEAVGFVAYKRNKKGVAVVPLNNHAANPTEAFFVEPWEQYRAEHKLEQQGYQILGVYHSHPNSEALPSMSDHTMARPGEYVFIFSVPFDELKAYLESDGTLEPVDLQT